MARIAGVNIPVKKRVVIALTYIHGIGNTTAQHICNTLGIPLQMRAHQLTEDQLAKIREMIESNYKVEGDKRSEVSRRIKELMEMACYRGLRHRRKLPVRGQNTHNNARTRKGPAKAIAGKKK